MTHLPEKSMDYGSLFQILMGPVKAELMMTGIALGIFNRLEAFLSAEEVARDMGAHPENTRRLLDALAIVFHKNNFKSGSVKTGQPYVNMASILRSP
jgi:hypothetical protein